MRPDHGDATPATFRKPADAEKIGADGLISLGVSLEAENRARRTRINDESDLHKTVFEPIGLQLDRPSSRAALMKLRDLERSSRRPLDATSHAGSRPRRPEAIWTKPGGNTARPPLDDTWSDSSGNAFVLPDKDAGSALSAVAADQDSENAYAAVGVLLWVYPQSISDILVMIPTIRLSYQWRVQTAAGPTAHTTGYQNVLIRVHDARGTVVDALTSDNRSQIWTAGSSGFSDTVSGNDTIEVNPLYVLREGAAYEVWFWTQVYGDAGSSFWGGWSSSTSNLSLNVEQVFISEA